ncbi:MAG TPA: hypothetical protein VK776_19885 [Bryobacteraceae bacterium]|nr:hypothetical protein [Bryobacteraceae bacterium]
MVPVQQALSENVRSGLLLLLVAVGLVLLIACAKYRQSDAGTGGGPGAARPPSGWPWGQAGGDLPGNF